MATPAEGPFFGVAPSGTCTWVSRLRAISAKTSAIALRHRNCPQCDLSHQADLIHIPSVSERFCNDREFAPT
jgi:hypothetical protein